MKHEPGLLVQNIFIRTKSDPNAHAIMIESGNDTLFFLDSGETRGRRYFDPHTKTSRYADIGMGWHTDWMPLRPEAITTETINEVCERLQGLDALSYLKEMVYDCPAVFGLLKRIIYRYQ